MDSGASCNVNSYATLGFYSEKKNPGLLEVPQGLHSLWGSVAAILR